MKTVITYFEIELSKYHDDICARIQYLNPKTQEIEQSALYSVNEINNIVTLWKEDELLGGFGIGTVLAKDAGMCIFQRG